MSLELTLQNHRNGKTTADIASILPLEPYTLSGLFRLRFLGPFGLGGLASFPPKGSVRPRFVIAVRSAQHLSRSTITVPPRYVLCLATLT